MGAKPDRISYYLLKPVHINTHTHTQTKKKAAEKERTSMETFISSQLCSALLMREIIWNNGQSGQSGVVGGEEGGQQKMTQRSATCHQSYFQTQPFVKYLKISAQWLTAFKHVSILRGDTHKSTQTQQVMILFIVDVQK